MTDDQPDPADDRSTAARSFLHRSRDVVVLAALTGALTGVVVAVFDTVVLEVLLEAVLELPLWAGALAPAVGLVVAALALRLGGRGLSPGTADEYLRAFHEPGHALGGRALVARMAAAVATLGSGGAMGLEGPSLYGGAAIGAILQRRLPRPFRGADHRTLLVAGAAAGVAAIFKAPATGVVFALEVPFRDDLARRMLLPALVAAASGYLTFVAFHGTTPLFQAVGSPDLAARDLAGAVALGVLAGLCARAFAALIRLAKRLATTPAVPRIALASLALVTLFVVTRSLTGASLTLGSGYEAITWSTDPEHATWLLLAVLVLRSLATTATVAGGGVGGLFIPLVVAGALLGRAVGREVSTIDEGLFTVVGVAAFLGAGYRVPLAAVMFVAETTGRPGFVVPGLLAAVAAELTVGRASVTAYQRDR